MESVVTDLVIDAVNGSSEAITAHFSKFARFLLLNENLTAIAKALDHGYDADLDEITANSQEVGYDHGHISSIFRKRLTASFPPNEIRRSTSRHIWEADESRSIYSLFGRDPKPGEEPPLRRRTRASAIVQNLLRDCRGMRHAEKSNTDQLSKLVTVPSPLNIARELLSDPLSEPSQVCAAAALQELIRERIEQSASEKFDLGFAAISDALTLINNRWKTSKPIKANLRQNGATVLFLCNLFAMQGLMAMRIGLDTLLQSREAEEKDFDQLYWGFLTGCSDTDIEFLVNPKLITLPDASAVLNLIEGLPLPLEGAQTIFQGGLRLSEGAKSGIVAISGSFGTGKTLLCLSLAAALAPLGCRTLFLSCEERGEDIEARLAEAASRGIYNSAPLFRALRDEDFRIESLAPNAGNLGQNRGWFVARQLRLEYGAGLSHDSKLDPASALKAMLLDAIEHATFLQLSRSGRNRVPLFARPVIVVDGLHQLFSNSENTIIEPSLRDLIEQCRRFGAIFIFTFASEAQELRRLEFLCDLMIELDRGGYETPDLKPKRIFRLLKARRQPSRTGAHIFHIKSGEGFRVKPSLDARVHESKSQSWWEPDERAEIFLLDSPSPPRFGSKGHGQTANPNRLPIRNHSQILILGRGSAGKAGLGLYILHRRWFDCEMFVTDSQPSLPMPDAGDFSDARWPERIRAVADSNLPVRCVPDYLETRVLVISFLYQAAYYNNLTSRLRRKQRKRSASRQKYGPIEELKDFPFMPLPDRMHTDTIGLYPGLVGVEEFLSKIDRQLSAAELSGTPYTGVLIDGLHNVFVQYPLLEKESPFWGIFYSLLRRRRVTVVTTHTVFDVQTSSALGAGEDLKRSLLLYDFEQAQRKIAPLLSALVSGSDYLFDLSRVVDDHNSRFRLTPLSSIASDPTGLMFNWDRDRLRLEPT